MDKIKEQKIKSEKIKSLLFSEGFQIIQNEMIEESRMLTNDLLDATDINEIHRLQGEIKAIQRFFEKLAFYNSIK